MQSVEVLKDTTMRMTLVARTRRSVVRTPRCEVVAVIVRDFNSSSPPSASMLEIDVSNLSPFNSGINMLFAPGPRDSISGAILFLFSATLFLAVAKKKVFYASPHPPAVCNPNYRGIACNPNYRGGKFKAAKKCRNPRVYTGVQTPAIPIICQGITVRHPSLSDCRQFFSRHIYWDPFLNRTVFARKLSFSLYKF